MDHILRVPVKKRMARNLRERKKTAIGVDQVLEGRRVLFKAERLRVPRVGLRDTCRAWMRRKEYANAGGRINITEGREGSSGS